MSSRFCIIFLFLNIFSDISALIELPQVEENNILEADTAIRQTTNDLFSLFNLKVNKDRLNLKQYSLIHNYLVSTSLQDYTNLKEIAKLTRVDKTRLNNETRNFMAIVNEILNEDIKHDTLTEDEYVVKHIEGFLTNFDKYTEKYEYSETIADNVIAEIFNILEKNKTFSEALNKTLHPDKSWLESAEDGDNLIDDNEFWVPNARRIFQGQRSTIKDFPFMVSIQVFNHFQCAGSIIKSDLIITAASCLQLTWNNRFFRENPKFLSVRVGSSFPNAAGESIEVLEIYFHPEYEPKTLRHNLCLLRLQRRLKFKKNTRKKIMKIDIDRKPNPMPVMSLGGRGIEITIVGWGAKGVDSVLKDRYISFAVLDIYPVPECQAVYSADYVSQKNFCAGFLSRGGGACNRDIGGPGIMNGILVGIISFGSAACGTPNAPTVFTKVGFYAEWIDSVIQQNVVRAKKKTTPLRRIVFTSPKLFKQVKTTFKIKPPTFTKKKLQKEKEQIEILRELRDKGLLKEFVNTVIGSEEAKEMLREEAEGETYLSTIGPDTITKAMNRIGKNNSEDLLKVYHKTSSETIEELSELEPDKKINTINDHELETQIEKDIMEIIERMNDFATENITGDVKKLEKKHNDSESKNLLKVLYLSEMEGNDSSDAFSGENKDSNEDGIEMPFNIPVQSFPDLTYRNNGTVNEIFLSKQDLIDLFSEALKEEFRNKTNTITGAAVSNSKSIKRTTRQYTTKIQPRGVLSYYMENVKDKSIYSRE